MIDSSVSEVQSSAGKGKEDRFTGTWDKENDKDRIVSVTGWMDRMAVRWKLGFVESID